jgi:hypothetical protein
MENVPRLFADAYVSHAARPNSARRRSSRSRATCIGGSAHALDAGDLEPLVAAGIDVLEVGQRLVGHVEREAVVGAAALYADADARDLLALLGTGGQAHARRIAPAARLGAELGRGTSVCIALLYGAIAFVAILPSAIGQSWRPVVNKR